MIIYILIDIAINYEKKFKKEKEGNKIINSIKKKIMDILIIILKSLLFL